MPLPMLRLILAALSGILLLGMSTGLAEHLTVGDKAPLITGKNAGGKGLLQLQTLTREIGYEKSAAGQFREVNGQFVLKITDNVVVLNFFATTCIPCLEEIPAFNRVADHFRDDPVRLVYVNVEPGITAGKIRRFMARTGIRVPMMLPNQREVIRKYDVTSLPRIVVIDREGKISCILQGFTENLESVLIEKIAALLPTN